MICELGIVKMMIVRLFCCLVVVSSTVLAQPGIVIDTPLAPPVWALLQREVMDANSVAIEEYCDLYFDTRGFQLCVER